MPTLLLVDDDPHNLKTLVAYLKEGPPVYEVLTAPNGDAAFKIAGEALPDLVITDWEMPLMNGLQLIQNLKLAPLTKHIPCIMVTGVQMAPESLREAMLAGAIDFVRKPVNPVELQARVATTLELFTANKLLMDQKNRELATQALHLHQKNQLVTQVLERLGPAMAPLPPNYLPPLKEIKDMLQQEAGTGRQWEAFKLHFEQVHPNFFKALEERGIKLSPINQRWCAYIRMGMSNHEIATLMHVDPAGARTLKSRLKKKLGIPADIDLTTFLKQL